MAATAGLADLTVLIFELDGHRYGLRAADIQEIARAALPVRLAQAPDVVEGIINVRGRIAAVLDLRTRFNLARRAIQTSDVFLVCKVRERLVALRVDAISDLQRLPHSALVPGALVSDAALTMRGVFALPDGLLFLADLPAFLSEAEELSLAQALARPDAAAGLT